MRTYARIAIHTAYTHAHGRTDSCTHACTHAYTHARVLFAHMFADTFQDPTASVGPFADPAGRQGGGHAHVRTYTQHAGSHAGTQPRTYKQHADARTPAQTHGHVHTCTTYTCTHESRRSTHKIQRGHSSSARTVCDGDRGQANANRRRKLGYTTADALRRDPTIW